MAVFSRRDRLEMEEQGTVLDMCAARTSAKGPEKDQRPSRYSSTKEALIVNEGVPDCCL